MSFQKPRAELSLPDELKRKAGSLTRQDLTRISTQLRSLSNCFEPGGQCRQDVLTVISHVDDLADLWGQTQASYTGRI